MLGLCAASSDEGLAALKAWTARLGLPRKLLHGMDRDGVPTPVLGCVRHAANVGSWPALSAQAWPTIRRPVFIKYNSASGDAFISGYGGEARGVLFTPALADGEFRCV